MKMMMKKIKKKIKKKIDQHNSCQQHSQGQGSDARHEDNDKEMI